MLCRSAHFQRNQIQGSLSSPVLFLLQHHDILFLCRLCSKQSLLHHHLSSPKTSKFCLLTRNNACKGAMRLPFVVRINVLTTDTNRRSSPFRIAVRGRLTDGREPPRHYFFCLTCIACIVNAATHIRHIVHSDIFFRSASGGRHVSSRVHTRILFPAHPGRISKAASFFPLF
jgi:hypothetical protein